MDLPKILAESWAVRCLVGMFYSREAIAACLAHRPETRQPCRSIAHRFTPTLRVLAWFPCYLVCQTHEHQCKIKSVSISGLVVEYIVAIDVTRVRFPADACVSCVQHRPEATVDMQSAARAV